MLCWVLRLSANFYSRSKPKSSPVEHFQERPLLYTQLGFVGSQHWTAEFKKITKPVLFMIFFKDFVTPQKRNMSEGYWLFPLKMAVQSLGNRDSTFRGFQPNVNTGKNH